MPRTWDEPDPDDGPHDDDVVESDSDELPDGAYHDDELPTVPCPYCRREILEDAPRCPHCENYLSREDAPPPRRSWFWVVMMLLALAGAALWVLGT